MPDLIRLASLGKQEYTPKNGQGYDVSSGEEYVVRVYLLDGTFDVVFGETKS